MLVVWLPLNGDLHNQGLSNINVINSGTTVDNNGKIGKCYSFNGSSYIDTGYIESFGTGDFTICCWMYLTQTSGKTYQCIIGNKTTAANSVGVSLYYNQNQKKFLWSTADGSNATEIWSVDTFDTVIFNQWHHIAMVRDNNDPKKGYFYFDGIRKEIASIPAIRNVSSTTSLKIGSMTPIYTPYYFTGKINDVRIYDHALSTKEVEEIAKGLVLHYKLDNYWLAENLLVNTHFDSRYSQTTGWDTSKNGTLLADSWGGYNSGVANQATVYHAHLKEVNGEYVYEYIKDANNSWLGIAQDGLQSKLTAGTKYTFSWEQYCVSGSNYVNTGLYYYKTGASSASFHLGYAYGNSGRVIGKWQKFTYTFTAPSDADYTKNMFWYIYGAQGGNGTFYARHFKLEKGDKATPWSPAKTDTLYAALGYNGTTVYDSSGYSHNGTIVGSLTAAAGSPRYDVYTNLTTTSTHIYTSALTTAGFANSFSISWWGNVSTYSGKMMWGFSDGNRLNGIYNGNLWNTSDGSNNPLYTPGTTTQVTAPTVNVWHHFVMTGDGSTCKVYKDGQLWAQAKTYKSLTGTIIYFNGWANSTDYTVANTKIVDFRVYATALTAEQVKELYNTSMSIDSNGNVYARELVEL